MDVHEKELVTLLEDAGLKGVVNYDIVELDGKIDIKIFNRKRCACLPREKVHEALEDCVLSTNREDYFWYLLQKDKY